MSGLAFCGTSEENVVAGNCSLAGLMGSTGKREYDCFRLWLREGDTNDESTAGSGIAGSVLTGSMAFGAGGPYRVGELMNGGFLILVACPFSMPIKLALLSARPSAPGFGSPETGCSIRSPNPNSFGPQILSSCLLRTHEVLPLGPKEVVAVFDRRNS
jgi:hypothetical protein